MLVDMVKRQRHVPDDKKNKGADRCRWRVREDLTERTLLLFGRVDLCAFLQSMDGRSGM